MHHNLSRYKDFLRDNRIRYTEIRVSKDYIKMWNYLINKTMFIETWLYPMPPKTKVEVYSKSKYRYASVEGMNVLKS